MLSCTPQLTNRFSSSVDEDEIDDKADELRKKLESEEQRRSKGGKPNARGLKSHQVHELAEAKIEETEKLRRALGISKDYEEGSHWRKQEERMRDAVAADTADQMVKRTRGD